MTTPATPDAPAAPAAAAPAPTPATVAPQQGKDPIAPERPAEVSAPVEKTFTQAEVNAMMADRVKRVKDEAATAEERIAALEQTVKDANAAAVSALVAAAATDAHDPADLRAHLNLDGLTPADGAKVAEQVAALREAKPYLFRTDGAAAPVVAQPSPGATATGTAGAKVLTHAEMERIKDTDLVKDPELMKRYEESLNWHASH